MSDRKSMEEWQLEETPGTGDQWQLLDKEQSLPADMQLQQLPSTPDHWQPVAYEEAGGSRGGWILPTLIIVALLAVLGYIGWLAMNGFDLSIPASPPPATEPVDTGAGEPGVVAVTTATEEAPTATPAPATPTATPEPTAVPTRPTVVQRILAVLSPYGVNARAEPGGAGEVVRVLDTGETGIVVDEQGEWVQIELDSGEIFWVSNSEELVEFSTRTMEVEEGDAPVAAPDEPPGEADAGAVIIRIDAAAGVNARQEPSADAEVVAIVAPGTTLTATALSDDGAWVEVILEDGQSAWLAVDVVTVEGDPANLAAQPDAPTTESAPAADATGPLTATGDVTGTARLTDTGALTGTTALTDTEVATDTVATDEEPPAADVEAVVTIDNLIGAVARGTPSTTAEQVGFIPGGSEVPALGRSANGDWIQVELEDGTSAWVFVGSIVLNVPVDTLPIVAP